MIITAKMTSKNQVTIPKAVRDLLALKKADTLEFVIDDDNRVSLKRQPDDSTDQFWNTIREQEAKYGSYDTPTVEWGEDVGSEKIDE